jgi:hypothetical protein
VVEARQRSDSWERCRFLAAWGSAGMAVSRLTGARQCRVSMATSGTTMTVTEVPTSLMLSPVQDSEASLPPQSASPGSAGDGQLELAWADGFG